MWSMDRIYPNNVGKEHVKKKGEQPGINIELKRNEYLVMIYGSNVSEIRDKMIVKHNMLQRLVSTSCD